MLSDLKVKDFTELTLGGNAPLASVARLKWNIEGMVLVCVDTSHMFYISTFTYMYIPTYMYLSTYTLIHT